MSLARLLLEELAERLQDSNAEVAHEARYAVASLLSSSNLVTSGAPTSILPSTNQVLVQFRSLSAEAREAIAGLDEFHVQAIKAHSAYIDRVSLSL